MNAYASGPPIRHSTPRRPTYTNASLLAQYRVPRVKALRSTGCGHIVGICLLRHRQRVIQWAVCQ